jgi:hypothetical protein
MYPYYGRFDLDRREADERQAGRARQPGRMGDAGHGREKAAGVWHSRARVAKDGRAVEPTAEIGESLPGQPGDPAQDLVSQARSDDWQKVQPDAWKNRGPNFATAAPSYARPGPRNTMARLKVDASGRLWLVCRSKHPNFWSPLGTVWTEFVTSYANSEWSRAIYVHHSDNLLDNRPALVSNKPGELHIIYSSDGRRRFIPMSYMPGIRTSLDEETPNDPYQNDLYMSRISPITMVLSTALTMS